MNARGGHGSTQPVSRVVLFSRQGSWLFRAGKSQLLTFIWSSSRSGGAKALDARSIERPRAIFAAVCDDFSATVEMDGEADRVHLLVNYPPTSGVSRLVNRLKGVSSRSLRQERADFFRWLPLQHALRSPTYFAASCSGAPLMAIKRYIQQQQTPQ